jgi:hypothetical protein
MLHVPVHAEMSPTFLADMRRINERLFPINFDGREHAIVVVFFVFVVLSLEQVSCVEPTQSSKG